MKLAAIVALSLMVLCPLALSAQYRRRGMYNNNGAVTPDPVSGVTVNVKGVLKGLSKKELLVETDADHTVSLRRTSKTKFLREDKPVKADDVALEEKVDIEVAPDKDAKLMAVMVKLGAPEKPETLKQR
ncbi:MAG: hypothetical protein ABSE21_13195 [Bryobacteraceae bacterium]|jgi:hypothetical protein